MEIGRYLWYSNLKGIALISYSNFNTSSLSDIFLHLAPLFSLYFINSLQLPSARKYDYYKFYCNSPFQFKYYLTTHFKSMCLTMLILNSSTL